MQEVSNEYKQSMKNALRERAYIMLSFGLVNQEAQRSAKLTDKDSLAYYSNTANLFTDRKTVQTYAALEENFTPVDGTMYFMPREDEGESFIDTGVTVENPVSNALAVITINLNIPATDIKGLTINFGANYPTEFDIKGSGGQTISITGNDKALFTMEDVLTDTTAVQIIVRKMLNTKSRLRIYSIRFGYGLVYYNDSVTSSSLESYVSPIGADVPQIDFTVQLTNYDKYFNVDNPNSAINFLETGQAMDISYGYQLPDTGEVEWIKGNHLYCAEWESDDRTATIRCHDIFRNMDSEYYKGIYHADGKSYYDLAVEVLTDAGIEQYYLDPILKTLYTKNPLPQVQSKEALQIIANACRCTLWQTRDGIIQIKSNYVPAVSVSADKQAPYSTVAAVLDDTAKAEYGSMAVNYTTASGGMYLLDRANGGGLNTGYVSAAISDENGLFTENPIITVKQETAYKYYGVKMVFGNSLPAAFIIRTYLDGALVTEYYSKQANIAKTTVVKADFTDFDTMTVEFTKTAEPYNRIVLNYFSFGDITDFTMERCDMVSSPKAIKQEQVKEVIVPCYLYQNGTVEAAVVSGDVTTEIGSEETYYFSEPTDRFTAKLDGATSGVTITDSGSYFVTVKYSKAGKHKLEVTGYRYDVVEQYATVQVSNRGQTIKWENPLIDNIDMAADLAAWLGEYYSAAIEYEYDTRGNPELDVNDIIFQENDFVNNMKVTVYRQTLDFNQAFSGSVVTRRVGGAYYVAATKN